MAVVLNLMACRQNAAKNTVVMWSGADPSARGFQLLLARRRMSAEEVARALADGHPEIEVVEVPATAGAVADDRTPAGQPCYYGVVAVAADGTRKPSRFRAAGMADWPEGTVRLSELAGSPAPQPMAAQQEEIQAEAPAPGRSPAMREQSAEASAPVEDRAEARRRAQRQALEAALARPSPEPAPPGAEEVAPPSGFPLARFGLTMVGATQTWDGIRILWEAERFEAAAYEVFIADHRLLPEEVGELVRGEPVGGAWVRAVSPQVRALIDNVTPRESRGWYAVVARGPRGERQILGCTAQGSDECRVLEAPFFDPARLEEVRELADHQLREARAHLHWWQTEQDVAAWREALRLCDDALAIHPGHPAAARLRREIERLRRT